MSKQKGKSVAKNINIDFSKADKFIFLIFSLLITLPLLFRGGYFEREYLPIFVGINLLFISFIFIYKKDRDFKIFNSPIEMLFIGIVALYLLSILYGVNKRESLLEFVKYFTYFSIMVIAFTLAKKENYKNWILYTILAGGVLVSIIGIGSAIGTWDYNGAMVSNRLSSTFQYPNTLAAYVASLYFLALTLLINEKKRHSKSILGASGGLFIFSLILTYSRAMWLMFPISLVLYFVLMPNTRKLETILYMISTAVFSLPISFLFTKALLNPGIKLWAYIAVLFIGTGFLTYIISLLEDKYRNISIKKILVAILIIFLGVLGTGIYIINATTEITLMNTSAENKWTSLNRNISSTMASTDYELVLSYTGEHKDEAHFMGRIVVYNANNKGEYKQIATKDILDSTINEETIPFTTEEDSIGIRVSFTNYYPDTEITIKESYIKEAISNEIIKNIPLKYKYIPEGIISRVTGISTSESSFTARVMFAKDGLKIIKKYPILGTGGGGWKTLYQKYQSAPYWTTLAHNYFLQLWIEIGILGLVLILFMLIIISFAFLKNYKSNESIDFKTLVTGIYVTIFTLLFHALIDFDMSMTGYAITVWVLVGILASQLDFDMKTASVLDKFKIFKSKAVIYPVVIFSLVIILINTALIMGNSYAIKAEEAAETDDIGKVMINYEKAVRFDRWEPSSRINLANTYMALYSITDDSSYIKKAISHADEYIKLAKYSSQANAYASQFYLSVGQIDLGTQLIEKSIEVQPLRTENYLQKTDLYLSLFEYYYSKGEDESAIEALESGMSIKAQIEDINLYTLKPLKDNKDLMYNYGRLKFYYDNFDTLNDISYQNLSLDFAYYFDIDVNNDEIPDLLRTSIPKDSKFKYEILSEDGSNYLRMTNDGEIYGFNYIYPLDMEPSTEYILEFKARGNTKPETFRTYIWSTSSKDGNQGALEAIELRDHWEAITLEFTTDSDVEPAKEYIRLQHNGNDEGYIDIKDIVVFKKIGE